MIIVGLMSGTSMDGVDAVACEITGAVRKPRVTTLAVAHVGYPAKLRRRIEAVAGADGRVEELARLNVEIGRLFGKAARAAIKKLGSRKATLVASHGQTVRHLPRDGATLQIGDPAIIAHATGLPVWSHFRQADMARGGEGAPLAPVAHRLLFGHATLDTVVLNIGGMANVTSLPAGATDLTDVVGFDIGPGMRLIDMATRAATGRPYDRDGALARSGNVVGSLLLKLLAHPFYKKRPPKSTGRELFNETYLADAGVDLAYADADLIATLTELTASVIGKEMARLVKRARPVDRLIVCGGGAKNGELMSRIAFHSDAAVMTSDDLGIGCDQVECLLMALLGWFAEKGTPLDLSPVTGAKAGAVIHGRRTPR